jgi:hypothetical protein
MKSFQTLTRKMGRVPSPLSCPKELPPVDGTHISKAVGYLWGASGAVPTLECLGIQMEGDGAPFKVCAFMTRSILVCSDLNENIS